MGPARSDWTETGSRRSRPRCRAPIPTSPAGRTAPAALGEGVQARQRAAANPHAPRTRGITSQDDLIGNAIEDTVVGEYHAGANWIVRGEGNVTNGWLKLQMR